MSSDLIEFTGLALPGMGESAVSTSWACKALKFKKKKKDYLPTISLPTYPRGTKEIVLLQIAPMCLGKPTTWHNALWTVSTQIYLMMKGRGRKRIMIIIAMKTVFSDGDYMIVMTKILLTFENWRNQFLCHMIELGNFTERHHSETDFQFSFKQ